jgi:hypothetical protein
LHGRYFKREVERRNDNARTEWPTVTCGILTLMVTSNAKGTTKKAWLLVFNFWFFEFGFKIFES